jgi:hypothetical protein
MNPSWLPYTQQCNTQTSPLFPSARSKTYLAERNAQHHTHRTTRRWSDPAFECLHNKWKNSVKQFKTHLFYMKIVGTTDNTADSQWQAVGK